ncbi:MAG: dockerin type I repeat-containing protein [Clostridia bacterium]|nr:dockerin type I repeat-containing protein [Clostridia bacterium]
MKKRILAGLLTAVFAFSSFATVFANEDVNVNEADVTAKKEELRAEAIEKRAEARKNILENASEKSDEIALMSAESDVIFIESVYSEDFYADAETFTIELYVPNLKDLRSELELSVVDEDGNVIAEQVDAYYQQNGLIYKMEVLEDIEPYANYTAKLSYTGSYEIEYNFDNADIYPITDPAIKNIEVVSYATNSFKIEIANVSAGEQYTMFYQDGWNGPTIKKDVKVASDKTLFVEFGDSIAYDGGNYIWLCEHGTTSASWSNCLDNKALYDFNLYYEDSDYDYYNDGIDCDTIISADADYLWFYMWGKALTYQGYTEGDVSKVDAYMLDATTGDIVGTESDVEFDADYSEIMGKIEFNTSLDESHEYIVVMNDGYTVRAIEDVVVTSEKEILSVSGRDLDKNYLYAIPSATNKFYAYVGAINISDRKNIKVELLNEDNEVVATSTYQSSSKLYLMTVKGELTAGEYTLAATYGDDLKCYRTIDVIEGDAVAWQNAGDAVSYNGKTYINAYIETEDYNPANLKYKVILADGTEKEAKYHRALDVSGYSKSFVVVVDEELSINYGDAVARLKMYDGSDFIAPAYDNNMRIWGVEEKTEPFIYSEYKITDTTVEMYLEGFDSVGNVTICAYDELTETNVVIKATSASNTSVKFKKSDLNKINMIHSGSGYVDSKELFIENNGEYQGYFWAYPESGLFNIIIKESFGFRNNIAKSDYEIINLPHNTYAYYKLADSESELEKKSYEKIDVGVLYSLKGKSGVHTVYAQFKTSGGVESDVMASSITIDNEELAFEVLEVPSTLLIDEYDEIYVSISVESNKAGNVYLALYDDYDNMIGYESEDSISSGISDVEVYFWADDFNYEDATKLVVYMEDNAGNVSEEQSFDVEVVAVNYIEYDEGDTYLEIEANTGTVIYGQCYGTTLDIPSEVDGVTITTIAEWSLNGIYGECITISIPATVKSIDTRAFDGVYDFILLVEEDTYAHEFAVEYGFPFELVGDEPDVTYTPGDVTDDGAIDVRDIVSLRRFVAGGYDLVVNEAAVDINRDESVDVRDVITLRRFIAGGYGIELQ